MAEISRQTAATYQRYPPVGDDDWRYAYKSGVVRCLEMQMLSRSVLADMANATDFSQAVDSLGASDYSAVRDASGPAEVERLLRERRRAVRQLFAELMHDKQRLRLMRARDDFANMRLAVRRVVTDRPIGADYSDQGNVSPEIFEQVFTEERYGLFPEYLQHAVERAILSYYDKKDIRQVDYAIDTAEFEYELAEAARLGSVFLENLFRIRIDLTNIVTTLRLIWGRSEQRAVLIDGGFLPADELEAARAQGLEQLGQQFYASVYYEIISGGADYLARENSFVRAERLCEDYMTGFLRQVRTLTAGPQVIIAYLLAREAEIRKVRFLLTAARHKLATEVVTERLSEVSI